MLRGFKKFATVLVYSIAVLFMAVGYAGVTSTLVVNAGVSARMPDYDEIVITSVKRVAGTLGAEKSEPLPPTNVKSNITGDRAQTVVYEIKAQNFSQTKSYVYAGIEKGSEFFAGADKVNVTASLQADGSSPLVNDPSATYYPSAPIAPGEEFVFYATYTLTENVSSCDVMIHYTFKTVVYSVTYLNSNALYAVDSITDNSVSYTVRREGPQNGSLHFSGWVNANAITVTSYPAGNTHDYTLSAKWDNVYLIIFADADGTVLYEEQFTSSSKALSAAGQAIVDAKLAELNAKVAGQHLSVTWSEYTIAGAKADITVRAIYNYEGYLNLEPVYELPDDGIVDYYKVLAVDTLPNIVVVPGYIGHTPVRIIERITNVDGSSDWDNFEKNVNTIIINEGVERLEHNSLAWTPNLTTVQLPSTITAMGKNTFSRNILLGGFGRGDDKKVLTINFNGTKAEWQAIVKNSDGDWAGGLKEGSVVNCSDGYFRLEGSWSPSWKSY